MSKEDDLVKEAEIELSVSVACHSAIMTIDHLGEVIVKNGKGSKLENIKLHRRKCTNIISNVVAPAIKEELAKDVKGKTFSVILDESTDISTTKLLCVMVRYHSDSHNKIMTSFVELVPVIEATGETLFQALSSCLVGIGLRIQDCIGYGCNGASVMVGEHNSVWSRLRDVAPNCIQVKCICHSLALCIKYAFETLPSSLGFLLSEIPKWFSKSTVRREAFKTLFNVMNAGNDRMGTPLPFQKSSTTRWLVRGKVVYNCLVNWEELKAYFAVAIQKQVRSQEALSQVDKQLPDTENLFKGLSSLHPRKVLSQKDRSPFNSLPLPHLRNECAEKIEEQYRKMLFRDWKEEPPFNGRVPDDTVQFWCGISQFRNTLDQNPFQDLAKYALACLTNPVSNAVVERSFSEVTAIKSKTRNQMGLELLSALVRIRSELHMSGKCCRDFAVTKRMLEMFNSEHMYNDPAKTALADNADEVFPF
eukprot:gene2936-biopygen2413